MAIWAEQAVPEAADQLVRQRALALEQAIEGAPQPVRGELRLAEHGQAVGVARQEPDAHPGGAVDGIVLA